MTWDFEPNENRRRITHPDGQSFDFCFSSVQGHFRLPIAADERLVGAQIS